MIPSETNVLSLPHLNGLTFSGLLITELFGNVSGGTQRTVIWESLSILGMHLDFEKAVHFPGLSLNVSGLYCAGYGLTDKAVHDLNVLSNIDSYDSLRLYEAWLQQDFANGQFSIRAGQLLADAEFFVSQYSGLFINSSFGALPLVSFNFSSPIFPIAAPGYGYVPSLMNPSSWRLPLSVAMSAIRPETTNMISAYPFPATMGFSSLPRWVTP